MPKPTTLTKRNLACRLTLTKSVCGESLSTEDWLEALDAVLCVVTDALVKGERIEIRNFGVFESVERKPRPALNPKTLEKVHIPARRVIVFKPGKELSGLEPLKDAAPEAESAP